MKGFKSVETRGGKNKIVNIHCSHLKASTQILYRSVERANSFNFIYVTVDI